MTTVQKGLRISAALIAANFCGVPAESADIGFEVASIRPHAPPLRTIMGLSLSGQRITLEGYTIPQLIMEAYNLKGMWQISIEALRSRSDLLGVYYDVIGRAPGDIAPNRDAFRAMLQTLLAERFQLTIHREMKETPVYALVRGKSELKLKNGTSEAECAINVGVVTGGQSYSFSNSTIDKLTDLMRKDIVDRPVIDKTELGGKYTFRIVATPSYISRNQPI